MHRRVQLYFEHRKQVKLPFACLIVVEAPMSPVQFCHYAMCHLKDKNKNYNYIFANDFQNLKFPAIYINRVEALIEAILYQLLPVFAFLLQIICPTGFAILFVSFVFFGLLVFSRCISFCFIKNSIFDMHAISIMLALAHTESHRMPEVSNICWGVIEQAHRIEIK